MPKIKYRTGQNTFADVKASDVGAVAEPETQGTVGQVLTSNGNGSVSWENPTGDIDPITDAFIDELTGITDTEDALPISVDYNISVNKPKINGVELKGNKTTSDLQIHEVPTNGLVGQVLRKTNNGYEWGNLYTTQEITIASTEWGTNLTVIKSIPDATANNLILTTTSDTKVYCSSQNNGSLTFKATSAPESNVTVGITIFTGVIS